MQQNSIQPLEFYLRPGFLVAHDGDAVVRCVLGSSVAVAIYDRKRQFGGINHFVWPRAEGKSRSNVTYGNVAIPMLRKVLREMGSHSHDMEAMIFGGACQRHEYHAPEKSLGYENVNLTRRMLHRMGIPVISEDVGGCKGRKIMYHTRCNEAVILKVDSLRPWDWYDRNSDIQWDRV